MNDPCQLRFVRVYFLDLPQRELAVKLGVAQSAISRWENGILEPDRVMLGRYRKLVLKAKKRELPWDDRYFWDVPDEASPKSKPVERQ
jgi:transcriptional regulator with XRE-family HTH domain